MNRRFVSSPVSQLPHKLPLPGEGCLILRYRFGPWQETKKPARGRVKGGKQAGKAAGGTMLSDSGLQRELDATAERIGGIVGYNVAKAAGRTVLSYRQWVQVKTPSFKRWWGYDWEKGNGQEFEGVDAGNEAQDQGGQGSGNNRGSGKSVRTAGMATGAAGKLFIDQSTGEPRVFYHGTSDEFTEFDVAHPNKKDAGWLGRGHYVSSDRRVAETYLRMKRGSGEPRVMELFVRPTNPLLLLPEGKRKIRLLTPDKLTRFNAEASETAGSLASTGIVF